MEADLGSAQAVLWGESSAWSSGEEKVCFCAHPGLVFVLRRVPAAPLVYSGALPRLSASQGVDLSLFLLFFVGENEH